MNPLLNASHRKLFGISLLAVAALCTSLPLQASAQTPAPAAASSAPSFDRSGEAVNVG